MSPLQMPARERQCAFCAYLGGSRPYTILHRSELTATLVTREQRGAAHLLVLPTRHAPTILDLQGDEPAALMHGVIRAARAIERAESPEGIAVWQNNGIPAGQAIAHVHFHVAGTVPGGGTERGRVEEVSLEATNAIADQLRPYFME
jgi:histidine triad (HIT) family protein